MHKNGHHPFRRPIRLQRSSCSVPSTLGGIVEKMRNFFNTNTIIIIITIFVGASSSGIFAWEPHRGAASGLDHPRKTVSSKEEYRLPPSECGDRTPVLSNGVPSHARQRLIDGGSNADTASLPFTSLGHWVLGTDQG